MRLLITRPRCGHCNRVWTPRQGVPADHNYCRKCRSKRREIAKRAFGLRPLQPEDFSGPYLLPRALRSRPT